MISRTKLVASLEYILPLAAKAPAVYNGVTQFGPVNSLLRNVAGFIDGPKLARRQLTKKNAPFADFNTLQKLSEAERANTVIIIQDAFTSYFESSLIFDLVKTLRKLGFNPVLAPYAPNGKPLHVHGFLGAFKRTAIKNANKIKKYNELGIDVILTAMKHEMLKLQRRSTSKAGGQPLNQLKNPPMSLQPATLVVAK